MTEIKTERISEELTGEGVTLIRVSISYPFVTGLDKKAQKRINSFYRRQSEMLLRHAKKRLMPEARVQYAGALAKSVPFKPFEVSAAFTVAYNADVLSIYRDIHIHAGQTRALTRSAQTWNAASGWFLELSSFFPPGENFRKRMLKNAAETAALQERAGTHRYFEKFPKLIRKNFSPRNFYITPDGIAIFFPELTVAPHAEGIPVFVYKSAEIKNALTPA